MPRSLLFRLGANGVVSLLGLCAVACGGSEHGQTPQPKSLDAAYKAFTARLPDRADEARPLTAGELAALERPGLTNAGLEIKAPIGRSLTDRPFVGWRALPGAKRYRVRITALDDGPSSRPIVDETTSAEGIPFPTRAVALAVGKTYALEVTTEGTAPASGRSRFDVLPIPYRSRWKTIAGDLASNEPDPVGELLLAHAALRRGLIEEADRRLRAFQSVRPNDADGATLRRALDALLGR